MHGNGGADQPRVAQLQAAVEAADALLARAEDALAAKQLDLGRRIAESASVQAASALIPGEANADVWIPAMKARAFGHTLFTCPQCVGRNCHTKLLQALVHGRDLHKENPMGSNAARGAPGHLSRGFAYNANRGALQLANRGPTGEEVAALQNAWGGIVAGGAPGAGPAAAQEPPRAFMEMPSNAHAERL
jgi:hypothetical protein